MGEISDDKLLVLKTIDILRDKGTLGILTMSNLTRSILDVWTVRSEFGYIALNPNYRKKVIVIDHLKKDEYWPWRNIGSVNFSTPEEMASEIENILNIKNF